MFCRQADQYTFADNTVIEPQHVCGALCLKHFEMMFPAAVLENDAIDPTIVGWRSCQTFADVKERFERSSVDVGDLSKYSPPRELCSNCFRPLDDHPDDDSICTYRYADLCVNCNEPSFAHVDEGTPKGQGPPRCPRSNTYWESSGKLSLYKPRRRLGPGIERQRELDKLNAEETQRIADEIEQHITGKTKKYLRSIEDVKPNNEQNHETELQRREQKRAEFSKHVESLINSLSLESLNDTPDFILSEALVKVFDVFTWLLNRRDQWYNREGVKIHEFTTPVADQVIYGTPRMQKVHDYLTSVAKQIGPFARGLHDSKLEFVCQQCGRPMEEHTLDYYMSGGEEHDGYRCPTGSMVNAEAFVSSSPNARPIIPQVARGERLIHKTY